ncbi:MAG: glycoside hydrolase [Balneolaceae bacterium]|nr:glycoside hydrolase [Balneolaceae bacterium]
MTDLKSLFISFFIPLLLISVCLPWSIQAQKRGESSSEQTADSILTLTVQPEKKFQRIQGFGASDAWSIQFVGKNWPLEKRNQMVDWLFSTGMDDQGNPEGIGLTIWRFNIGAGSARQGEASGIGDEWRRAESFLAADSTYDWSKQAGQQWFMKAAHERGADTFIGFVNSPPILHTINGYAYGDGDGDANLSIENYPAFAEYLATIARYFEQEGIPFDYLSPVNEPQWDWSEDNGQEGSPYQNAEFAGVIKALDHKLQEYELDTKIEIPETAQINFLYDGNLEGRSRQADFFFGPQSAVKELQALAHKVAAHSYFTTWPVERMIEQRKELSEHLQKVDPELEYWMTEYCILADNEQIQGNGKDLGMDPALYVARLIHFDLAIANASSWQWWLAVSPYDYKDGLIYIEKNRSDGAFTDSKLLWAVGNYSRFVRPGASRIGVSRSDNASPREAADEVMASAYVDESGETITIVAVNYGYSNEPFHLQVEGAEPVEFTPYLTNSESDLEKQPNVGSGEEFSMPARSVVTFVGEL